MQNRPKKRRRTVGPNKNDLRAARSEHDELRRTHTGTLRQRFPHVETLQVNLRMESPQGALLETKSEAIGRDEPLLLDIECPGGCGGGKFLLTEAVETLLQAGTETRQGIALCQAGSYADPRVPCSAKLTYQINIHYGGDPLPPVQNQGDQ